MSYSVWLDGIRIGDTDLELRHGLGRRGGVFHPTEVGLTVLPGITAMGPALLDLGQLCRENGVNTKDGVDIDRATEGVLGTDAGRRMLAAAEEISRLELHDDAGRIVRWESILISDMTDFVAIAAKQMPDAEEIPADELRASPVRYFISTTLRGGLRDRLLHSARKLVS